jgi:hypothetical protein
MSDATKRPESNWLPVVPRPGPMIGTTVAAANLRENVTRQCILLKVDALEQLRAVGTFRQRCICTMLRLP